MPTRYLKPGIRDSEIIDRLNATDETMFYRLLVTVDDYGRTDARPQMVKAACFPIKEAMTAARCAASLKALAEAGLVELYEVDGKPYLQMCKWDNTPRAGASKYPQPAHTCAQAQTGADNPRTLLPLTVTETETETDKGAARKRTATFDAEQAELPAWLPREAWAMWCKDRKARGKPISKLAVNLQFAKLADYMREGHKPQDVIKHSIAGGYQGLFPPKAAPGAAASLHPGDWRETRSGIEGKGKELGLPAWDQAAFESGTGETFKAYTSRVFKAAKEQEQQA